MKPLSFLPLAAALLLFAGCATVQPKDYTAFRQSRPRSILVLPPTNETTEINAPYSFLTTTTRPLAELGYYVFPVAVVDEYFKQNGVTSPDEIQKIPLPKLREVFGADAVLYLTVEKYGSKYQVLASTTYVYARGKLIDCRTGTLLWEGSVKTEYAGQSGLLQAIVTQVMNKLMDQPHAVAMMASAQLLLPPGQGLLKGPRHPEAGKD